MQKSKILFLIRAFNEATRIPQVLESIISAGFTEILVVNDGSTDGTRQILEEQFQGKIYAIHHLINRGGGAALETGFSYIRRYASLHDWEYVVTFDADGQHDIADMQVFLETIKKHPKIQIVYGSRFITKTHSNVPKLRRIILWWGKIFTSIMSWVHLTDAHNGYRMFRIDVIEKIHLTMDGMEYASELIDEIYMHGFSIKEVPVNIHYDTYTLAKWQKHGGVMRIVLKMIYKKFFL
jgi:polyprenyl-phospho-N-acetylgalactosaminyl synthase